MKTPDPDQMLQSMEVEIALIKARHSGKNHNRNAFRIMSILFLVIGTLIAVAVLHYLASELPVHQSAGRPQPAATEEK